jgi:hypothetical protein
VSVRPMATVRHSGMPQVWLGVNFWSRAGGPRMWVTFDEEVVRKELAVLAQHGLNVTRSFFYLPDFMPAPDTLDERCCERYAQFLDLSAEAGLGTIPTFIVGHMSGENWDVDWRGGRDLYVEAEHRRDIATHSAGAPDDLDGPGTFLIPWDDLGASGEDRLAEHGLSVRCLLTKDLETPAFGDDTDLVAWVARAY